MKKKVLSIILATSIMFGTAPVYAGEYMTPVAYTSGASAYYTPDAYTSGASANYTPDAYTSGASANYTPDAYTSGASVNRTPDAYTSGASADYNVIELIPTSTTKSTKTTKTNKSSTPSYSDIKNNAVPSYAEYIKYNAKAFNGMTDTQKKLAKTVIDTVKKCGNATKINLGKWNLSKKQIQAVFDRIIDIYLPLYGIIDFDYTSAKKLYVYISGAKDIRKNNTFFQKCKNIVASYVPFNGTTKDKVLGIERAICNHMTYSYSHNINRAINNGTGACDMYSNLFAGACVAYNIPCMFVGGDANAEDGQGWGKHAWNKVLIGSTWYYADVTWVDTSGIKKYQLSKSLWKDHRLE